MQQLRSLLEASWNQSLMGNIPTTPAAAAHEIAHCMSATTSTKTGVSIIDLQLPMLDLRQGTRWYDAVLAADVAHLLVEQLLQRPGNNNDGDESNNRALLLVRDQATVRTIERVWSTRNLSAENDKDEHAKEEDANSEATILYDDFADFGFVESIAAVESSSQTSASDASDAQQPSPKKNGNRRIQLKSLFGDALMSEGADMEEHVIRALQANVVTHVKQQQGEEQNNTIVDTIVMIAPVTRPEVMAIRALVQKYSQDKRIILLNPHFNKPRPVELQHAQTVYSLRPFLVRAKESQETLTKIVVLKRKKEWELFISNNEDGQFERLAVKLPKGVDAMDGPSMEWVATCAQKYLQTNGNRNSDDS